MNISPAMNVLEAINNHINVYQDAGQVPPPYRVTRKELKAVWRELKQMLQPTDKEVFYDDLVSFMGVDIEVVTIG